MTERGKIMPKVTPELSSAYVLHKLSKPILTKDDMPYEASLIFNAGVIKHEGKYLMVFRNDYGTDEEKYGEGQNFRGTSVGLASAIMASTAEGVRKAAYRQRGYCRPGNSRLYDRVLQELTDVFICVLPWTHVTVFAAVSLR